MLDLFCCSIHVEKPQKLGYALTVQTTGDLSVWAWTGKQWGMHAPVRKKESEAGEWCDSEHKWAGNPCIPPEQVEGREVTLSFSEMKFWPVRPQHSSIIPPWDADNPCVQLTVPLPYSLSSLIVYLYHSIIYLLSFLSLLWPLWISQSASKSFDFSATNGLWNILY